MHNLPLPALLHVHADIVIGPTEILAFHAAFTVAVPFATAALPYTRTLLSVTSMASYFKLPFLRAAIVGLCR